ncbi:copper-binding protein [Tundrisphaera lichenicola]|uniref:copper-binding protein n=1 Tax=Tundrisphaera lichenicola TaxID=2029860 RepID=UPI003EBE4D6D
MRVQTFAVIGMATLVVGCGGEAPPSGPAPRPIPSAKASSKTYRLKGVVRKVDAGSGEVTITHEEIPGFMPAMTMPFTLEDRASLEDIRPGDEVEGPLRVESVGGRVEDYDLIELTVTRPAIEPPPPPIATDARLLKIGDPVPDFTMTTQEGGTLKLSDLKGKVVVLTFIYTRCPLPDFCPAMDAKFADLARRIAVAPARAEGVRLLSVSFDPEHDTPAVLAEHAKRRGAEPPLWTFAVASHEQLAKVADPLGLTVAPGAREISHNLRTAVIGPDGRLARLESGQGWSTADLLGAIYSFIPPTR